SMTDPWDQSGHDFDMGPARRIVLNTWRKVRLKAEQLLVDPFCWGTLDYSTITDPDTRAEMQWIVNRTGIGHGLVLWFDAVVAEGICFSNAPGDPDVIYKSGFFPWPAPVALSLG